MTTNFKVWIDTPVSTFGSVNVQTLSAFQNDTQRIIGWYAGDTISSIKMNSILRQNSLIIASLMEAFCSSNTTLSLLSSVAEVKAAMLDSIATKGSVSSLSSSVSSLSSTVGTLNSSVTSLQTSVTNLTNGTTAIDNSLKLGGQLPTYYQRAITSGTAEPFGGSNGDIYIQY